MNTIDAIYARRAVKHYDPAHRMSEEEINRLLEAVLQAPTAFNIQNTRLVTVIDPEIRKEIRAAAWDQAQVTDSSLLVVMCADRLAWKKDPIRYWRNAPKEVQEFMVPAIVKYYEGKEQVQRDECMRSCGLAGMALMLAAQEIGYESCPMDGFDFDAVGRILNLPGDHVISFMIAIGKGTRPAWEKPGQLSFDEVIIRNRF